MSRAYSIDLRERVVAAMVSGASARAAASQFGVSVASAVRWSQRQRRTGGVLPGKLGGHRKPVLLPEREWLLARVAAEPDLTLRGLLAELADRGVKASYGALWLFLEREGLSFKKKPVPQRAGSPRHRAAASTVAQISEPA
jgi:transposase